MRPARKGPENRTSVTPALACGICFNEAGPQGAGKPRRRPARGSIQGWLQ